MDAITALLNTTLLYIKQALSMFRFKVILSLLVIIAWYILNMYYSQQVAIDMLFMFMVIDFLLWFWLSIYNKTTSSFRMWIWLGKFIAYFVVIFVWYAFDMMMFWEPVQYWMHYFFIVYLWITELISIWEHLHTIGIDLPLIRDLKKIRKEMQHKSVSEIIWDKLDFVLHHNYNNNGIQKGDYEKKGFKEDAKENINKDIKK